MSSILVIEDETSISQVLRAYLQKAGFEVTQIYEGNEAVETFDRGAFDLALIDVMLPGRDGWAVLEHIRNTSDCPCIMLTALGDVDYRLKGFDGGADDYIPKPFEGDEVVARVQAVLRRSGKTASSAEEEQYLKRFGSLVIDEKAYAVTLNGLQLDLTPRDLSLLIFLGNHPNQFFDREQLISHVWGIDYEGSDRAVDLAIKRIRRSLKNWPVEEGEIRTLRGVGYQLSVKEE
ncbi:response regulator transcription factor [Marinococcus sp. PL1-022]|jgi:DNA-binding response OmpR family regulator|uniref:response regulator transcription factor n=1 Tax=Marinococcus sp. PL1-022 TaxID=3095363 RepID=UPI002622FD68|nr:response regulator transcription factor [Marinococcus sp. PL1-022]MDX6153903.1 response regulator transcription factor [Marinococcus sp. PL1-022]